MSKSERIALAARGRQLRRALLLAALLSLLVGVALLQLQQQSSSALAARVTISGAARPMRIDPTVETPETTLAPAASEEAERAGLSVALSANGDTALVGAPGQGEAGGVVWVFARSGSTWQEQAELQPPEAGAGPVACFEGEPGECGFGRSVALSADGNTALIGAPRENSEKGAAWIFTREGSTWTNRARLTNPRVGEIGNFGLSVALAANGETALVGAPGDFNSKGQAWVFTGSGSNWTTRPESLTGGEGEVGEGRFGVSVALSGSGELALVGGPDDSGSKGAAWAFEETPAGWHEDGPKLTGGDEEIGEGRFGGSVALSQDGSTALVGARMDNEGIGGASVYARSGTAWSQQGPKLKGSEEGREEFGYGVALSADGDVAAIGAPKYRDAHGTAWQWERTGTTWALTKQLQGGEAEGRALEVEGRGRFGASVAVSSEDRIVVGGPHGVPPGDTDKGGSAWVFGPAPSIDPNNPGGKQGGNSSSGGSGPQGEQGVLALGPISVSACGVSLLAKTLLVQAHVRVLAKLRGTGVGRCAGKLRLRVRLKSKHAPTRLKTIGTAVFSITAGRTLTVKVKLNATGIALLAAGHGRLNASLLIVKRAPAPSLARTDSVHLRPQPNAKPKATRGSRERSPR